MKKRLASLATTAVGIIITIACIIGVKSCNMSKLSGKVRAESYAAVQAIDGYQDRSGKIDAYFEPAHEAAFKMCCQMGGYRQSGTFDDSEYVSYLFGIMLQLAMENGDKETLKILLPFVTLNGIPPKRVKNLDAILSS